MTSTSANLVWRPLSTWKTSITLETFRPAQFTDASIFSLNILLLLVGCFPPSTGYQISELGVPIPGGGDLWYNSLGRPIQRGILWNNPPGKSIQASPSLNSSKRSPGSEDALCNSFNENCSDRERHSLNNSSWEPNLGLLTQFPLVSKPGRCPGYLCRCINQDSMIRMIAPKSEDKRPFLSLDWDNFDKSKTASSPMIPCQRMLTK